MDEYVHRWMILYGLMSFLHEWISFMIGINLIIIGWISPLLESKLIQIYLYPSSFVVKILIFQTWMSFNNDG